MKLANGQSNHRFPLPAGNRLRLPVGDPAFVHRLRPAEANVEAALEELPGRFLRSVVEERRRRLGRLLFPEQPQVLLEVVRHGQRRVQVERILGDLFQGAITYGEAGQFLTPMPVCRLMARMTIDGAEPAAGDGGRKSVCDPCVGSGRMLLAVAETHRHWEFVGQDVDLRCVRMTALNLAFRNLYGYVIHGNSLTVEKRLVYRTGFNGAGFLREVPLASCPAPVQSIPQALPEPSPNVASPEDATEPPARKSQLKLF